jgi:glucose-6-phosphate isomerase, archaeal
MIFAEPRLCSVSIATGMLVNGDGHYRKTFRELAGLYADGQAFERLLSAQADDVAYEVTSYAAGRRVSDFIMGVTRMKPGKVGREFYLTRGHIHAVGDRPEIYHVLAGHGIMQMESLDGEVRLVEMRPQDVCYVPPFWIHRSINVGEADLVMFFSYPADSGQDYGVIEKSNGMRVRIVEDGRGGWQQEENRHWRPRDEGAIAAILARSNAAA